MGFIEDVYLEIDYEHLKRLPSIVQFSERESRKSSAEKTQTLDSKLDSVPKQVDKEKAPRNPKMNLPVKQQLPFPRIPQELDEREKGKLVQKQKKWGEIFSKIRNHWKEEERLANDLIEVNFITPE